MIRITSSEPSSRYVWTTTITMMFSTDDCMPALLAAAYPFDKRDAIGIIEDELCGFEIDAVSCLVELILLFIPFESDHV